MLGVDTIAAGGRAAVPGSRGGGSVLGRSSEIDTPSGELPPPWSQASVTVVVPTYNEAENLPVLAEQLLALPLPNLRVLVVDDGSPDGTGRVADALAESQPGRVAVVHRRRKAGLGRAYLNGFHEALVAGAEFVVQSDADLSHPPVYIPQMLGTMLATAADLVIGSRYVAGGELSGRWPLRRRVLSAGANAYVEAILKLGIRDRTAGFKVWRADALRGIGLDHVVSSGYAFQVEMHYLARRRGLRILEVPIRFDERRCGESKVSASVTAESLVMPLRLRRIHGATS